LEAFPKVELDIGFGFGFPKKLEEMVKELDNVTIKR
jgi:hypothetical protein